MGTASHIYFVADDLAVEPDRLYDEDELVALGRDAVGDGVISGAELSRG